MYDINRLRQDAVGRRAFLARMSAAGLGAAAIALLDGCSGSSSSGKAGQPTKNVPDPTNFPGVTGGTEDQAVLNYALSLERLEANLYLQALNQASGRALTTALDATQPTANSTGNYTLKVAAGGNLSSSAAAAGFLYLVQFAYVEAAHRDFLIAALGNNANPIMSTSGNYKFPNGPGSDLSTILTNILPLEETGVRAYLGAVQAATQGNNNAIANTTVQAAGTIYSTECRHSAAIEYILGLDPGPSNNITGVPSGEKEVQAASAPNVFEKYLLPATVLSAVTAYFA